MKKEKWYKWHKALADNIVSQLNDKYSVTPVDIEENSYLEVSFVGAEDVNYNYIIQSSYYKTYYYNISMPNYPSHKAIEAATSKCLELIYSWMKGRGLD